MVEGRRRGRGSDRACLGLARVIRRGKGVGDKEDREQRYRREGLQDTWQGGGVKTCVVDWITGEMKDVVRLKERR